MDSRRVDVAIIGGGLVGSLAACLFAKRGHQVDVYEYRSDIRQTGATRGRTINLSISERGRKALAQAGLEYQVLKYAIPLKGRMVHLPKGQLKAMPYDPIGDQCIYTVDRKQLNEILLNETDKYSNIQLHFEHKLVDAQLESGLLTFLRTETNTRIEVRTELAVGADGAFSALRGRMLRRQFNYEQHYIAHGYIELNIPPVDGNYAMAPDYLHLWPNGDHTMVAMPNQDKSWSVTLFMPFSTFDSLDCPLKLIEFFTEKFADFVPLIGKQKLVEDFFRYKPSSLVSIKCYPYHVDDRAVLIGDAAHAMVPFYGQGMNAGLEDCMLLDELAGTLPLGYALKAYTDLRWQDAHAICDLALYNFQEISSLVAKRRWRVRRTLDNFLYLLLGAHWMPLYQSVCFTTVPYSECRERQQWQSLVVNIFLVFGFIMILVIILSVLRQFVYNT